MISLRKPLAHAVVAFALSVFLTSCTFSEGTADNDAHEANDYTGGIHDAILHDFGTIVGIDAESEQATVYMDESGLYSKGEVVFSFAKRLQPESVDWHAFEPGDRVEVSYFYIESREGVVPGESLAPLEERTN